MASERILKLRDLIDNYDELLKYVPIQDLVVRVTGFSAHFIALDKETQNEIIARSYWQ